MVLLVFVGHAVPTAWCGLHFFSLIALQGSRPCTDTDTAGDTKDPVSYILGGEPAYESMFVAM